MLTYVLSQYLLRLSPNSLFNITPFTFSDASINRTRTPSTDLNHSWTEKQMSVKFVGTDENTFKSILLIGK